MRFIIVGQCHLKCPTMATAQVELIFRFFDFSIFKLCGRQALKLDTRERERGLFALRRLRVSLRQSSGRLSGSGSPLALGQCNKRRYGSCLCSSSLLPRTCPLAFTPSTPHSLLPCRLQLWVASCVWFYYAKLSEPLQARQARQS